jgi:hypothetical protein
MRRALSLGGLLLSGAALAAPLPTYELSLQDGHFIPPQLAVKAGERFKIVLHNLGQGPAEFEHAAARGESVVPRRDHLRGDPPAHAGTYPFFDEFNPQLPEGSILAE